MHAAIYARVSTERQGREQTIEGQLSALQDWAAANGYQLLPEHVYRDEGYSGSRLDRPGLDRLRDAAQEGAFEVVGVLSPDRLARKYAYQALLLEEFRRVGCAVAFVQRPISEDPHDQLLLQIQGAVAEYERAVLGERFRRGKLQKAREGVWTGGRAPYGYRYEPKRDGAAGRLVLDEAEATLVRLLFAWLVQEGMTTRQIIKRLNAGPGRTRSGSKCWSTAVVHRLLSDPLYPGTAYANRYRFVPPRKPRLRGPRCGANTCRQPRPREEWVPIPVPPVIDRDTSERAQAQLRRNAVLSFRHNARHAYLLRCLVQCRTCGLAMHGVTHPATARQAERRYYKCRGKDCIASGRERPCPQRMARVQELDAAVWAHVQQLLSDPEALLAQFQDLAGRAAAGDEGPGEDRKLEAQAVRLAREEQRLIDAYQAEVISLEELGLRRQRLAERRRALAEQRAQAARLRQETAKAQAVLTDVTAFCERVRARLGEPSFADKQAILQLLVERVIVGEDTLEIRHVIPLRRQGPQSPTPAPQPRPTPGPNPVGSIRAVG
jgi:site-specific DNA recombinase